MSRRAPVLLVLLPVLLALRGPRATADDAAAAESAPVVRLLDAGAEPRSRLRVAPELGQAERMTMVMRMALGSGAVGVPTPRQSVPPTRMVAAIEVTALHENGDIAWQGAFEEVDVLPEPGQDPAMVEIMREAMSGMRGVRMSALVDARGRTKASSFEGSEGLDPDLQRQLDQTEGLVEESGAPLPEEPVGVGARWEVAEEVTQNGMTMQQTATYRLLAMNGPVVDLEVTLRQEAEPQDMDLPALPAGATARLVSFHGEGQGTMRIHLGRVAPMRSRMSTSNQNTVRVSVGGQVVSMATDLVLELEIEGALAEATTPR